MTNGEIIERVKKIFYEKNMSPSDKLLSNRQIFNKLISARNRVISQEASRNNYIDNNCYQSIKMVLIDDYEGLDDSSFKIPTKKSLLMLPEILSANNRSLIRMVSDVGGRNSFYQTTWHQKKNIIGNKYTKQKIYYYIFNNYLYVLNTDKLSNVIVSAIFADPLFDPSLEESDLSIFERRFAADARMIDSIVALTIEELINKKLDTNEGEK